MPFSYFEICNIRSCRALRHGEMEKEWSDLNCSRAMLEQIMTQLEDSQNDMLMILETELQSQKWACIHTVCPPLTHGLTWNAAFSVSVQPLTYNIDISDVPTAWGGDWWREGMSFAHKGLEQWREWATQVMGEANKWTFSWRFRGMWSRTGAHENTGLVGGECCTGYWVASATIHWWPVS